MSFIRKGPGGRRGGAIQGRGSRVGGRSNSRGPDDDQARITGSLSGASQGAREAVGLARRGVSTVIERIDPGTLAELIVKATALQEMTNTALRGKGSPYRISEISISASIPPGSPRSAGSTTSRRSSRTRSRLHRAGRGRGRVGRGRPGPGWGDARRADGRGDRRGGRRARRDAPELGGAERLGSPPARRSTASSASSTVQASSPLATTAPATNRLSPSPGVPRRRRVRISVTSPTIPRCRGSPDRTSSAKMPISQAGPVIDHGPIEPGEQHVRPTDAVDVHPEDGRRIEIDDVVGELLMGDEHVMAARPQALCQPIEVGTLALGEQRAGEVDRGHVARLAVPTRK